MNGKAKEIVEILENNGFKAYLVGGYVRDLLLSKTTNDIDICTNATPEKLRQFFKGKANLYGSFRIKVDEFTIDITTFRNEKNYQNRRPTAITFSNSLKEDLWRRDFTINTICMNKKGKIIDLLNGREDLQKKCIRMVGNSKKKLKEDPLRILRAIRLATVLDFFLDENLEKEIRKNKNLLKKLSGYRIKEEISKILLSSNYKKGLFLLKHFSLCEVLGISFQQVTYTQDLCGMWAQIDILKNLPFTKKEKENIVKLRKILDVKKITLEDLYEYGLELSLVGATILKIDISLVKEFYNNLPLHSRKDLCLSYLEICTILKMEPCRKVKAIEQELIKKVLNGCIKNKKEDLKKYLCIYKKRWFN